MANFINTIQILSIPTVLFVIQKTIWQVSTSYKETRVLKEPYLRTQICLRHANTSERLKNNLVLQEHKTRSARYDSKSIQNYVALQDAASTYFDEVLQERVRISLYNYFSPVLHLIFLPSKSLEESRTQWFCNFDTVPIAKTLHICNIDPWQNEESVMQPQKKKELLLIQMFKKHLLPQKGL